MTDLRKLAWSCDERGRAKGERRNAHGCHCAEIADLQHASAAKDAEIARLREAFDPDRIHAQTIEAMTDAWNDICADTGCHPLDIERKGRELTFSPRHWADQTATWLIVKLCGETESDEATLKEPSHG